MNDLIAPYSDVSLNLAGDGVFTYSVSPNIGFIDAMAIRDVYEELDAALDVEFVEVSDNAEIRHFDWYEDTNDYRNSGWGGYASTVYDNGRTVFEIHTRPTTGVWYRDYIHRHEIGHALGLGHPFDDGDGDGHTWDDATTADTIMSYDFVKGQDNRYRRADWDTLIGFYGGRVPEIPNGVITTEPEPEPERDYKPKPSRLDRLSEQRLEKFASKFPRRPEFILRKLVRRGLDVNYKRYVFNPDDVTFILNGMWSSLEESING